MECPPRSIWLRMMAASPIDSIQSYSETTKGGSGLRKLSSPPSSRRTAIGTVGLALIAFYTIIKDGLRELYWRPEWGVNFRSGRPDCNRIARTPPVGVVGRHLGGAETHYVRARIHNVGRVGAEDVEVSVV
jgi:hypothetical protein